MADSVTFGGSTELDNGMTVSMSFEVDVTILALMTEVSQFLQTQLEHLSFQDMVDLLLHQQSMVQLQVICGITLTVPQHLVLVVL
jgi:uncharacterized metal-binding protein